LAHGPHVFGFPAKSRDPLRADICVGYKGRNYPLELKIHGSKSRQESLEQLFSYMNKTRASEGWLVVFDKDFSELWDKKIYWETQTYKDKIINVVGCYY
jgi:poly(3-hydroxybutyrate) depolymerase